MSWDRLRDIMALQDRLSARDSAAWRPPVDVYETDQGYVVCAELPGVKRDAIHIEMRDSELTIRGERREDAVPANAYHQMERLQGPFARTFMFNEPIDADRISAEFVDGVLTVKVPKGAQPEPRRIDVQFK
jgi:HSP20 family protein